MDNELNREKRFLTKRFVTWLFFSVVFALLPFLINVILLFLHNKLTFHRAIETPELLFFSIMICATTVNDLFQLSAKVEQDVKIHFFLLVFFLGAVFSAILYGVFCFDSITAQPSAAPSVFKTRLSILSTIISIGILIFGLLAQRFISRITDE